MPIINPSSSDARNFKGLHLYHFSMSNCSQKARFCLEEKILEWTSLLCLPKTPKPVKSLEF